MSCWHISWWYLPYLIKDWNIYENILSFTVIYPVPGDINPGHISPYFWHKIFAPPKIFENPIFLYKNIFRMEIYWIQKFSETTKFLEQTFYPRTNPKTAKYVWVWVPETWRLDVWRFMQDAQVQSSELTRLARNFIGA